MSYELNLKVWVYGFFSFITKSDVIILKYSFSVYLVVDTLKEPEVRAVVRKYLRRKPTLREKLRDLLLRMLGIKPLPYLTEQAPSASGPDIIADGIAIEVKGSNVKVGQITNQLARYLFSYKGLYVAVPLDAISYDLLAWLEILSLCRKVELSGTTAWFGVSIIVVDENDKEYLVREYSITGLMGRIRKTIKSQFASLTIGPGFNFRRALNDSIKKMLRADIWKKGYRIVKEEIEEETRQNDTRREFQE